MAQVAGSSGEFTLSSLNDSTPFLALSGLGEDPAITISGTFVGTITLYVSNQAQNTKTRTTTIATYSAAAGPLAIPRALGRWFALVMTAYTSGTAYIGTTAPVTSGRDPVPASLSPQTSTNIPAEDSF